MAANLAYSEHFFAHQRAGSQRSAEQLVPFLLDCTSARSVVDVGCGIGTWISVALEHGIEDVLGLDGDWVLRCPMAISPNRFRTIDLDHPVQLHRRFDLAWSFEVAEHLNDTSADGFIAFLCSLADVVAFSAAVPNQGGTSHRNEQWPIYWAERFASHGYGCHDILRPAFWLCEDVDWWYVQNGFVFARRDAAEATQKNLRSYESFAKMEGKPLSLIHPRMHDEKTLYRYQSLSVPNLSKEAGKVAVSLPPAVVRAVRRRLARWAPSRKQELRGLTAEADGASTSGSHCAGSVARR